jgi:glutathione S-transferase
MALGCAANEEAAGDPDSVAMMLYLAQKYGPTPLLPGNDSPALARVLQMTVFGETAIGMSLNPLLRAHFMAPEADNRYGGPASIARR